MNWEILKFPVLSNHIIEMLNRISETIQNDIKSCIFFFKKNPVPIFAILIVLGLFTLVFNYSLQVAFPFCKADDWRYILLFLKPFIEHRFHILSLWQDPSHINPLYSFCFLMNAKYFNLRMDYFVYAGVISQLFLSGLFSIEFYKSTSKNNVPDWIKIAGVFIINLMLFSFATQICYLWGIQAILYLAMFLMIMPVAIMKNRPVVFKMGSSLKSLSLIVILIVIPMVLFCDWVFPFFIAAIIVFTLLMLVDKPNRKSWFWTGLLFLVTLLLTYSILRYIQGHSTARLSKNLSTFLIDLISHPVRFFTLIGVELISGIFNEPFITNCLGKFSFLHLSLAALFNLSYLYILILFFKRKLFKSSIIPPMLMIFALLFIGSLVVFRNNLILSNGYSFSTPRYIIFYQVGLVGYFWSLFLIVIQKIGTYPNKSKIRFIEIIALSIILTANWIYCYQVSVKQIPVFQRSIVRSSNCIREKAENDSIVMPANIIGGKKPVSKQVKFLKENNLNVFAPNYPYQEEKK
jgi:hypothetical protein